MTRILAAILLGNILACASAFATTNGIVGQDEHFNDAVADVVNVTRNYALPAEQVKDTADRAFGQPNAVKIKFKAQLRGWDFMPSAPDADLTIGAALADARNRLFKRGVVLAGRLDDTIKTG